ncbi:hypothetical protein ASPZODRAFT_12004 [Penicilliopsis zonata CBS 506.65]|uniref:Uncharacterized protein n=1 Tax=Penicilliopsis zonata CBS 506.65 TaxID=1073090 RepID=A0A1L9SVC2_9EURO|nr:hypothetical protein ASPZODRAFT_12004 [Penicilliopsis zonata CBS 506.65]OJJ51165.1 hypothetical protein ASPZODRAFT_12004 [Penicilliopsis zonata CBS 506.65]
MSLLTARSLVSRTRFASFHIVAVRRSLNENDTNRDNLGTYYEAEKQDQLKSTYQGKAKWKQELASSSESSVKADRGEIDNADSDFSKMQAKTKDLPNRSGPVNKTQ